MMRQQRKRPKPQPKHGAVARQRRKRWGLFIRLSLMFGLTGGAAYALYAHVRDNEYFLIKTIRIVGAEVLEEQDILKASGVTNRHNILLLDVDTVSDRVASLPFVKTCRVVRIFPDTVVIEVEERHPVATLCFDNRYFEVDEEGVAVREVPPFEESLEPYITNIPRLTVFAEGMQVGEPEFHEALAVWSAFSATPMANEVTVSELAAYDEDSIWMICDELPYTLRWGRSDYIRQAQLLNHLWVTQNRDLGCAEYLELRFDNDLACR